MDCPFIQTLKTVDLTVLIVDYQAGSLSRTWCGLEVHYTTQQPDMSISKACSCLL